MPWDRQRLSGQHETMQLIWEVTDKKLSWSSQIKMIIFTFQRVTFNVVTQKGV